MIFILLTLFGYYGSAWSSLFFCEDPRPEYRIIGGRAASVASFPWQAVFFNLNTPTLGTMCGATVLDEKWILTAAHCVVNASSKSYVNVGVKSLSSAKKTLKVSRIFVHPSFDLVSVSNDIALVEVSGRIPFSSDVSPVCVTRDDSPLLRGSPTGVATGFGMSMVAVGSFLSLSSSPSDILQETEMPVMEGAKCGPIWATLSAGAIKINRKKHLCAGSWMHGTAPGDSGGPLHIVDGVGRYVQVGVTSFGANGMEGLVDQQKYPGVYTRVSSFIPWMEGVMASSLSSSPSSLLLSLTASLCIYCLWTA